MFYDNFHLLLVLEKSLPTVSGLENQTNQHTLVGLQEEPAKLSGLFQIDHQHASKWSDDAHYARS